jgi:autotransporter family porin
MKRPRSTRSGWRWFVVLALAGTLGGIPTASITPAWATSSPPPAGGYFGLVAPGAPLPSGDTCAGLVHRSAWEPRPENATANRTSPAFVSLPGYTVYDGFDDRARGLADRVNGRFQGTTDEIMQWASCKWGIPDDIVRAMAVTETGWYQGLRDTAGVPVSGSGFGDFSRNPAKCQVGYSIPCPQSFGLLQVKATSEPGTFPWSRDSTAFNVDYALMVWRVCYEGGISWLARYPGGSTPYQGGDPWGCVGFWYSGNWYGYDGGATTYIQTVKGYTTAKPWVRWADRSPSDPASGVVSVNDTAIGTGTNQFEYVGTWYDYAEYGAFYGDVHANYSYNDYYRVRFTGSKVDLYGSVGPEGGGAAVSVDGGPEQAITFYASAPATQRRLWSSPTLPATAHVLKVRNTSAGLTNTADRVDVTAAVPPR